MTRSTIAVAILSGALGCSGTEPSSARAPRPAPDDVQVAQGNPPSEPIDPDPEPGEIDELQIIAPGEVVPAFSLTAEDGTVLDSAELVGKKPFVMVFFASWCKVCEQKLPMVMKALEKAGGDITIIGVALDNSDTWERVAGYVERHDMGEFKLVRGHENRKFAIAYNPFGTVPVVEVIDKTGVIAELQKGLAAPHEERLVAALEHVNRSDGPTP